MNYSELKPSEEMLNSSCQLTKEVGDIVRLGNNAGTEFEIVHIEGATAWIREPVTFRGEALIRLARLTFVRRPSLAQAIAA
jgi:hypothetical protein